MERFLSILFVTILSVRLLSAQPMSGSYSVGGTSPDFVTLQTAADALKSLGVSGTVTFNIRPGVYMRNGGNSSVLTLDSIVAGLSPTNRITFQPDASAGGTVENVTLRLNRTDPPTADRYLVAAGLSFVTLRNITLEDVDSSRVHGTSLLRLTNISRPTMVVEDFILEGCRLIGSTGSGTSGTDFGIAEGSRVGGTLIVRHNRFVRLMRAISLSDMVHQATISIEDNEFLEGYSSSSGSGNRLGAAIEVACTTAVIRRNLIDFTGSFNIGYYGIYIGGAQRAVVERNQIAGIAEIGMSVNDHGDTGPTSALITNNVIRGGSSFIFTGAPVAPAALSLRFRNVLVAFNTIIVPGGSTNSNALVLQGTGCTLLNNIIINNTAGFNITCTIVAGSTILRSDYNIIYRPPGGSGTLIIHDGAWYSSLSAFQGATGLDSNSASQPVDFANYPSDLHLTECQSQDPDMRGIPVAGIVDDIDGDVRSPIGPNRGADEAGVRAVPLFGDVQRIPSQGTPFAIAVGDIDGQAGEDLAVPDFTNSQVRIYRNNGASRTFTHTGTLSTGFRPGDARFVDFDADGNLDLIVSGEDAGTAAISIFWGTGSGTFPTSVTESVVGRIRSIEPEPFRISPHFRTIAFTTSRGGLLPNSSLLGFLVNYGQRDPSLITDLYLERDGPGVEHDTLPAVMYDLLIANLDADSTYEIASLALQDFAGTPVSRLVLLDDLRTIATGLSAPLSYEFRGTYSLQSLRTTSYLGHTSSIVGGDFDGDGDQDLVTTEETTRQCVFLRNQGELQFVPTSISVNDAFGVAKLDYDGDGDLDFVTVNRFLEGNGVSAFLNDGTGQFRIEYNCHQNFASGLPYAAVSSDFDLDGRTDIAIASAADSVYVLYNFGGATNSVEGERAETPAMFALAQNYPNPFNPATTIRFTVPELTHVNVTIYDLLGRKMKSLLDGWVEPGAHTMSWDGRNDRQSSVASGAYVVRMEAKGFVATKKILLVR